MDVLVSSNRNGFVFARREARGRIFVAGTCAFNELQLSTVANLLLVPAGEKVRFVDAVTGEEVQCPIG